MIAILLLACTDVPFEGSLDVDLSEGEPVFYLRDMEEERPDMLSVSRCVDGEVEPAWELYTADMPLVVIYGEAPEDAEVTYGAVALVEGATYAVSLWDTGGSEDLSGYGTEEWDVTFVMGDPDSVTLASWCEVGE